MAEKITVKPTSNPNPDGSGKVIAGVPDLNQPEGSLFIAVGVDKTGEQVEYKVVKSPLVEQLLLDRQIVEVEPKRGPGRPPKSEGSN